VPAAGAEEEPGEQDDDDRWNDRGGEQHAVQDCVAAADDHGRDRTRERGPSPRIYTALVPTRDEVMEVLRQVEDPELGMDIVDLGLLYDVAVEDSTVKITYSLTSMGCPAGPLIAEDIDRATREVPGVEAVELELTFDPPWTPDRMSDDAKFILGFG
jgi:metal-sulfur cluster biosynthetic enzyme